MKSKCRMKLGFYNLPKGWTVEAKGREEIDGGRRGMYATAHIFVILLPRWCTQFSGHHDWQPRYQQGNVFMGERLCGHTSVHFVLMSSVLLLTLMCCVHGWKETDTWEVDVYGKGKGYGEKKKVASYCCNKHCGNILFVLYCLSKDVLSILPLFITLPWIIECKKLKQER